MLIMDMTLHFVSDCTRLLCASRVGQNFITIYLLVLLAVYSPRVLSLLVCES